MPHKNILTLVLMYSTDSKAINHKTIFDLVISISNLYSEILREKKTYFLYQHFVIKNEKIQLIRLID